MQVFQTAFKPSRIGLIAATLLYAASITACVVWFYGWQRIIGLLLLAVCMWHTWCVLLLKRSDSVHQLVVTPRGEASVFLGSGQAAFQAELDSRSLLSSHILFLKWQLDDRIIWQYVFPDSSGDENFRKILVWARWEQPKHK